MKDWKLIVSVIGGTLAVLVGVSLFFSSPNSKASVPVDTSALIANAVNSSGPEAAPVTVVEFSDLQCEACRASWPQVESLLQKYPDKIRFIYRHFPLTSIHQHAVISAIAAEAAASQGKFWEYATLLFDQQDTWSQTRDPKELFTGFAKQIEIADPDKFQKDLENQVGKDRVLTELQLGNKFGVNATPTFFVNGEKTTAAGLQLAVEKVLSRDRSESPNASE